MNNKKLTYRLGLSLIGLMLATQTILVPVRAQQESATAFVNVNVVPMDRERVLENQTVLVEGDRVTIIEAADGVEIPDGAQVVDGNGAYLIPGLTDAHTHSNGTQVAFNLYLAYGITTLRVLNAERDDFEARAQVESGERLGPTTFLAPSAGGLSLQAIEPVNGLARIGQPFFEALPIPGVMYNADQARQFVMDAHAAGADYVKTNNALPLEAFDAIVATADEMDLKVTGHVSAEVGVPHHLRSGVEIQHVDEIFPYLSEVTLHNLTVLHEDDFLLWDENLPEVIDLHLENNLPFTPTLVTPVHAIRQLNDLEATVQDPVYHFLPPADYQMVANPETNGWYQYSSFGLSHPEYQAELQARGLQLVRAFSDAGVMLLAGTDSGFGGAPIFGPSLHEELALFVEAGMTPYQALETATRNPATVFDQIDEWGTIEVGKRADLVLLNANPLDDIANTMDIAGVMVRGQWSSAADLQQILDDMVASYDVIELEPYTNAELGISGVAPPGWNELMPGVHARGNPAIDPTMLVQLAVPNEAASEAVAGILANLGAPDLPDVAFMTLESENLSWSVYIMPGPVIRAVATAANETTTFVVAVQADESEFDAIADGLLMPVVRALAPRE